ncbi:MAG: MMPL family transporter [Polyangia bacterium]
MSGSGTSGGRPGPPLLPLWVAAALLAAVAAAGAIGGMRLRMVEDVGALLPEAERADAELISLARRWGWMRRVAVVVGPGEPGSDRLHEAADAVAEAARGVEGVGEVLGEVDSAAARRAAEVLMERALRLYRPEIDPLDRREAGRQLDQLRERLASPEAMMLQRYLLADPFGMARGALRGLESAGRASGAVTERGHLLSSDRRRALVLLEVEFDPLDVGRAARFTAELDDALRAALSRAEESELGFTALGGPHFSAASAGVIMGDVRQAFVLTAAAVLLVFGVCFRRLRMLPAALLPGGVGIAVALSAAAALGVEMHALTLGFAATITGISVDYAIHFLHRARRESGGDRAARAGSALRVVTRPLLLGCGTTVAAFLLVATSEVPGMRQLALFAAVSVPVALAASLLLLPAFHRLLLGPQPDADGPPERWSMRLAEIGGVRATPLRRVFAISPFVALLAIGAAFGIGAPLSGDPRDLGPVSEGLERREAEIRGAFPGLFDQVMVLASAETRDGALAANDELYGALLESGIARERIVSLSPFLPAGSTQRRALEEVRRMLGEGPENLLGLLREKGFSESYEVQLKERLDVEELRPEDLEETALEELVAESLREIEGRWYALARVSAPGKKDLDELAAAVADAPGCSIVSERLQARRTLEAMQGEMVRMIALWLAVAVVALALVQRSPAFGLRAAFPALVGVAAAAGLFGVLGRPLTPVAAGGMTLVMGLAIDYGIFMQPRRADRARDSAPAVITSALTTTAGFGVLAASRTRAMADLGWIVLVGVSAAVLTAVIAVPAMTRERKKR